MIRRFGIGLFLLLFAFLGKAQEVCNDPEEQGNELCWRMVFKDNFGMGITARQIDFMELSVFQGSKQIQSARYAQGRLCVSLTNHQHKKVTLSLKGRCWRRLSTSRIQIWTFEQASIPIDSDSDQISILLINYNCI
jgi:hypothetical protein